MKRIEPQRKAEPVSDWTKGELREKGFEIEDVVPIIGVKCLHLARDVRVVAKGRVGVMLRCRCGYSGLFVPVPTRPLSAAETDLMVALAREAAWPELS